ncbi:MAG: flagellar hook-length control protein FliK, partial [Selenomonadaceae bacterium]|nr:flagellar hook-length control protein FliK [Selenomonadaceae bacterium]
QQVQVQTPQQQNLNPQQVQVQTPQQQNLNLNPQQVQVQTPQQQNLNLNPQQVQVQTSQQNLNLNPQQVEVQTPQQQNLNLNPQQVQVQTPQQQNLNLNPQQVQVEVPNQNQNLNLNQQQIQVESSQSAQFAQEISPVVNSVQSQVEVKPLHQNQVSSNVNEMNLQIEENQPTFQNIPVQQIPKQFEQQNDSQNFQQNFNQNTEIEVQGQQNFSTGGESFTAHISSTNDNSSTVQQTSQTQTPENAQNTTEDFNIPKQIVEQARMIRRAENTEMVINLKPEHLGSMTLKITVSQSGALNAAFYSDNAQVRAAIENSLVQLKQELSDQGLKVENVEVYAGLSDGGLMNGKGQQAWQQNQQQNSRRGRIDFSKFDEKVDATQPVNNSDSSEGVDYKV